MVYEVLLQEYREKPPEIHFVEMNEAFADDLKRRLSKLSMTILWSYHIRPLPVISFEAMEKRLDEFYAPY